LGSYVQGFEDGLLAGYDNAVEDSKLAMFIEPELLEYYEEFFPKWVVV